MQDAVLKVQKLGVPPKGFEDWNPDINEEIVQLWNDWIKAVDDIQRPVTWEEAEILIKCCPVEPMSEVEWTMLHCIESVFNSDTIEQYRSLIEKCNSSMMKAMLLQRLQNYIASSGLSVR